MAFLQTSEQVPATQTAWDVILVSDLFIVQLPDSSMWLVKTLVCWFCPAESGKLSKVFVLRPCFCFVLGFVTHESESRTENMLQCNWRFSNFLLSLSLSVRPTLEFQSSCDETSSSDCLKNWFIWTNSRKKRQKKTRGATDIFYPFSWHKSFYTFETVGFCLW